MRKSNYAIATVTDTKYLVATQVLLYSFLKKNPDFEGDIVIIEIDLEESEKASLQDFPNVYFKRPTKILLERLEILSHYWEVAKENPKQFFSLEAFNLSHYEKVLFLDSDMLCIGNIMYLFRDDIGVPLVAVADSLQNKKQLRQYRGFLPCNTDTQKAEEIYYTSFNSGFFLLNYAYLPATIYFDLVKLVNPIFFQNNHTRHTDQFILNQYFYKQIRLLSDFYNYLLNVHPKMPIREIKATAELKFIHYLEYTKPWNTEIADDSFGSLWKEYYLEFRNKKDES